MTHAGFSSEVSTMQDNGTNTGKRSILFGAVFLLAVTSACGSSDGMEAEDMRERLGDAREEVHRHHMASESTPSLLAMRSEAAIHEERMNRIFAGMHHAANGMPQCSPGSIGAMRDRIDAMRTATHGHFVTLDQARDLGPALDECASHYLEMSSLMSDFDGALAGAHCSMMRR
jgi:hypothetical protein